MSIDNFSVLISIYKKEKPIYFRQALDSLLGQSLQATEIVLVEDGPLIPELYSIIEEYKHKFPSFKIVKNETNLGLGLALAKGIQECSYDFIARMDTDDIIPTNRFEKQIAKIKEGYDVVSCWSLLFENTIDNVISIKKRPENNEEIVKLAKKRSPVCHPACVLRKSSVLAAGNYQHCMFYEDYWLWGRMFVNGAKFYNFQEPLYYIRVSLDSVARRGGIKYLINEIKTLSKFYKIGFYSLFDFLRAVIIRIPIRIMPLSLRQKLMIKIWKTQSK